MEGEWKEMIKHIQHNKMKECKKGRLLRVQNGRRLKWIKRESKKIDKRVEEAFENEGKKRNEFKKSDTINSFSGDLE